MGKEGAGVEYAVDYMSRILAGILVVYNRYNRYTDAAIFWCFLIGNIILAQHIIIIITI